MGLKVRNVESTSWNNKDFTIQTGRGNFLVTNALCLYPLKRHRVVETNLELLNGEGRECPALLQVQSGDLRRC